jgi:SNF2 family DNA or RNA helicase
MGEEKGSLWKFNKRYCVYGGFQNREIVGYTSMSELKERFDRVSLRRTKEGVLDLPEKVQITEYVEMDKDQEKIYISVKKGMQEEIDRIKLSKTPLSMFTRLRQATSLPPILSSSEPKSAKIERAFELATEAIEEGNKVVIFSNWTTVTDSLMKKFSAYNPALITGQVKDEMRGSEKDRFMNDEECKICIGSIAAMGTGLTLTSANTVIFIDEPWTKAIKDQCEDRCHRIGTKNTVFVYTLITKNTVDERVNSIVEYKGKMSDFILGEGDMPVRIKKIAGMDTSEVVDFLNS